MRNYSRLRDELLRVSAILEDQELSGEIVRKELGGLAGTLKRVWRHPSPMTAEHARIVACLFRKVLTSSRGIEPVGFLRELYGDLGSSVPRLRLFCDLVDRGLVELEDGPSWRQPRSVVPGKQRAEPSHLIGSEIKLADGVVSYLLNGSATKSRNASRPFRSNAEFLDQWFQYIEARQECVGRHFRSLRADMQREAETARRELEARSRVTRRQFPFQRLIKKLALTRDEQTIVMFTLLESLNGRAAEGDELRELLGTSRWGTLGSASPLSEKGTLRREGVIYQVDSEREHYGAGEYLIAPEIATRILGGRQSAARTPSMPAGEMEILSVIKPKIAMTDMVLSPETMDLVRKAVSSVTDLSHKRLADWGLVSDTDHAKSRRHSSGERLLILLHGHPGTGKTALAHAIAHHLKRPLLSTDMSKILDKWVGESQKRLALLFGHYNLISAKLGQAPVLLLNEADQFMSSRIEVTRSVDRMYNSLQSILLEKIENFSGILVATTNLLTNFDSAFSRRFDLKIELPRPGVAERRRLWEVLIPKKLPLSNEVDTALLAKEYPFTGGQISVVIRNAATAAVARRGKERRVRQDDLVKYAELERTGGFETESMKAIGFTERG